MYNKSMGYIIEKMRGDSLTPLGTGKSLGKDISNYPEYSEILKRYYSGDKLDAMSLLVNCLYGDYGNTEEDITVNYGKWYLVVDPKKFFSHGFYYETKIEPGMILYLFGSRYLTNIKQIQFCVGCELGGTALHRSFGLYDNDVVFKKKFGIRTLQEDFYNHGVK